ncbi:MAG TPA: histidine phosphatase family protein [Thermoanaerobaculia bacterium]|jgi:phosphohistidine phosphatase SixA|nr:histidine phosphatase family protein [Thermoanaerobaculia bacterium]
MLKNWKALLAAGLVVVAVGLVVYWYCWPCCTTTVIVLRHAEKVDPSPLPDDEVPLTTAGETRAETLAQVLDRSGVTKIYVTEKLRTQQTAKPLALARGITPVEIPKANTNQLVSELLGAGNRRRVIVVVGHSDTVPDIVTGLGGGTVTVGANEFDNLFVITRRQPGPTRIILATYGEPR